MTLLSLLWSLISWHFFRDWDQMHTGLSVDKCAQAPTYRGTPSSQDGSPGHPEALLEASSSHRAPKAAAATEGKVFLFRCHCLAPAMGWGLQLAASEIQQLKDRASWGPGS